MTAKPADLPRELRFERPLAFLPDLEAPSIFSPAAEAFANRPGVYVWVVPFKGSLQANYVGMTRDSMRDRQIDHLADMFTGGAKVRNWQIPNQRPFHYDPSSDERLAFLSDLKRKVAQVLECLETLRIMCCPLLPDDHVLKRVESGLIRALRVTGTECVEALDNDCLSVNWLDLQALPLVFPEGVVVRGFHESIPI